MSLYQSTFNAIKQKNQITEYVISQKSKGVYNSKLIALNNGFVPNKIFKRKIGIQFNNTPLVVE